MVAEILTVLKANIALNLPQILLKGRPDPAGKFLYMQTLNGSSFTF